MPRPLLYPPGTECESCGRDDKPIQAFGWCHACHQRWLRAGRPDTGPPPPRSVRDPEGHFEDWQVLYKRGLSRTEIARLMGMSYSRIAVYEREAGVKRRRGRPPKDSYLDAA